MTCPDGRSTILEPKASQERMVTQVGLEMRTVCGEEARQPRMKANKITK